MIVRIMGEGQVNVADEHLARLNALDDDLMAAVEKGEEEHFRSTFTVLLAAVREAGEPLPADALEPSDLILPGGDATIDEVRAMLSDDGLIPG